MRERPGSPVGGPGQFLDRLLMVGIGGGGAGGVYALEATMGDNIWHFETDYLGHSSPAVIGGIVYVGSTDGYVYAITEG